MFGIEAFLVGVGVWIIWLAWSDMRKVGEKEMGSAEKSPSTSNSLPYTSSAAFKSGADASTSY